MNGFEDFLAHMIGGSLIMLIGFACEIGLFIGWFWMIAKVLKWIFKPSLRRRRKNLKNKIVDADYEEIKSHDVSKWK